MKELTLREVQIQSLEILIDIDKICRENLIKYFIVFGTLIGAVRHKGFIPWDDDIDVGMTRENYNKFLSCYKKAGKFRIVNFQSEPLCPYMISRISDDRFKLETEYGSKYAIGTFVDVYPYDGIGSNNQSMKKMVRLSNKYSKGLARSLEYNPFVAVKDLHRGMKKWLLLGMYILPKVKGSDYYRKKLIELTNRYAFGCAIWSLMKKECIKKEWIEKTVDMEFEGIIVMAPQRYDEMLKYNFGNYMELPPIAERVGHHFYKIYKVN